MKALLNRNLAFSLIGMIILTIIAPPAWAQGAATQVTGRHRAFISQLNGKVEVKSVNQNNWVVATLNREVKTGDKIRTGPGSKCRVKVGNVGDVELQSSSEVTVGNLQQVRTTARAFFIFQRTITRDDVAFDQKSGDLRNSFRRVEGRVGNYNIYTPVATAGVRGTKFELDLEGGRPWYEQMEEGKGQGDEEQLTTTVLEGEVELVGPNWSRSVSGGQALNVISGQTPGNPGGADPNKLQELQQTFETKKDVTPPTFNGAISATRTSPTSVNVRWNAASDDSSAVSSIVYDLYSAYSSGGQDFTQPTATTDPGALSYSLTNLNTDQDVYIVVRARDEVGNRDNNTVEVSVVEGQEVIAAEDVTPPDFDGAKSVSRLSSNSIQLEWSSASDDVSSPDNIAYDIYLSTYPNGQDFSTPSASSDSGATSLTITNLVENQDYYVVVRARDSAGNRDDNREEVTTYVMATGESEDTTAVLSELTEKLFEAYENESSNDFLDLISTVFAGINNSGNVLTYSTLSTALSSDFASLENITVDPVITSVSNIAPGFYTLNVTWNGIFKFAGTSSDKVLTGQNTKLTWDATSTPKLVAWEGSSLFGLSAPEETQSTSSIVSTIEEIITTSEGGPAVVGPPSISSMDGLKTSIIIDGNYIDVAPYSVTINGENFQTGAKLYSYDNHDQVWEDLDVPEIDFVGSIYYINSTQLRMDISKQIEQYDPYDQTSEDEMLKIVNPDGQVSNIYTFTMTRIPGPLVLISITPNNPVTTQYGSSYHFTVEGYNLVVPLSNVEIQGTDYMTEPNFTVSPTNISVHSNQILTPIALEFDASVSGPYLTAGTYYVSVTDARGQNAKISFTVADAGNVVWSSNMALSSDYYIAPGTSLTVNSGVTVSSTSGAKIIVDGTLNANGAIFNNVGIAFNTSSSGSLGGITVQNVGSYIPAGIAIIGGNITIDNTTVSNCEKGMEVSGGTVIVNNSSFSSNMNGGIFVTGGTVNLNGTNATGNTTFGLGVDGSSANVLVAGGNYSSNTGQGIFVTNGANVNVSSSANISNNSTEGLLLTNAGNATLNGATLSANASAGIHLDPTAGSLSLSNTSISGSNSAIGAEAGNVALNSGNNLSASNSVVDLSGSANLSTTGSNTLNGNGTANAGITTNSSSSGSITIGDGTVITSAFNGILINGSGPIQITGASTMIENNTMDGVNIANSSSNVTINGGAKIQGNGNVGVIVGDAGTVLLNGIDILNNASFGVMRPSASTYAGSVSLDNVLLQGNNGQGAANDTSTAPPTFNSTQYQYLIYPPNTVSNPS